MTRRASSLLTQSVVQPPPGPAPAADPLTRLLQIAAEPVEERRQDVRDGQEALTPLKQALAAGFAAFRAVEPLRARFDGAKRLTNQTPPGPGLESAMTRLERDGVPRERLNELVTVADRGLKALGGIGNLYTAERLIKTFGQDPAADLDAELREIEYQLRGVRSLPAEVATHAAQLEVVLTIIDQTLSERRAEGLPNRVVGVVVAPDDEDGAEQTHAEMGFDPLAGRPV